MKYDSLGREVDRLEYSQDKLERAWHSTYGENEHGDWVRQHETFWSAKYPDIGFTASAEYYREITYYAEGVR